MTDTEQEGDVLSINVGEDVESVDGTPATLKDHKIHVLTRYVPWNGTPARPVTDADVPRVMEEAAVLAELCSTQTGVYSGANAVAHNQIDNTDPLRFFVASSGEIIINPVILSHTKVPVDSVEACMSFPERPPIKLQRYHKITARFQQLTLDKKLSEPREEDFAGPEAKCFQHEVAHLNGHSIFDDVITPEHAIGEAVLTTA